MEPCGENSCHWCEADLNHRYQTAGCRLVTDTNSVLPSKLFLWVTGGKESTSLAVIFKHLS